MDQSLLPFKLTLTRPQTNELWTHAIKVGKTPWVDADGNTQDYSPLYVEYTERFRGDMEYANLQNSRCFYLQQFYQIPKVVFDEDADMYLDDAQKYVIFYFNTLEEMTAFRMSI